MSADRLDQIIDGRYKIIATLGAGSFGTVYEAEQLNTKQRVALKLLRLQDTSEEERQLHIDRFRRECRLCGELAHPHIVRLLDSGELEDVGPFLVFEKVQGRTLADILEGGGLGISEATWLMTQVLDALAYAHRLGIKHRDIKPQNIMVTDGGLRPSAVILDFGIGGYVESLRHSESAAVLTRDGGLGTPAYADREQLKGMPVDQRADLYSWGLVFVECLQRRRVVRGEGYQESLFNHLKREEHVIDEPLRSTDLGALLAKVIQKNPDARPPSAEAIFAELRQSASPQGPTSLSHSGDISSAFAADNYVPKVRRQLTIITGILRLKHTNGSSSDSEIYDRAFQQEMNIILRKSKDIGAYVFSVLADKFILLISFPEAIPHEGLEAVRVVTELREASNRRHNELLKTKRLSIDLRFAINTGLVTAPLEVRNLYDFGGNAFNVAARLCSKVGEGQCLISEATYRLLSSTIKGKGSQIPPSLRGISLIPQGEIDLGFRPMARVYELSRSVLAEVGEGLTSTETLDGIEQLFVGREQELQTLQALWDESKAGYGQALLFTGDAGIGKSRLVRHFARHHSDNARVLWIQAYAEGENSFYRPLIVVVEQMIGETTTKVGAHFSEAAQHRFLERLGIDVPTWGHILRDLLALGGSSQDSSLQLAPSRLKEMRMELLLTIISRYAGDEPLTLIVEDLHFADPQTIDLVAMLLEELRDQAIFCIMTARPVFSPPWAPDAAHQRLLKPLKGAQLDSLITAQVGPEELSDTIINLLRTSSDGVPLFVEELTQTVLDLKQRGEDVQAILESGASTFLSVPKALYGGLMSRIDSLGAETQQVLRTAAVLGRDFSADILGQIMKLSQTQLRAHLETLRDKRLLFHLRSRRVEERYTFKHALLQQIAYDSLPQDDRVERHLMTAQTLEERFPDKAKGEPGLLRYHFQKGQDAIKAITYSLAVVKQAQRISAEAEAYSVLKESIEWLDQVEDGEIRFGLELELYTSLMLTLTATTGFGSEEMSSVLDHLGAMVEGLDMVAELYPIRSARMTFLGTRGEHEEALRLGEENLKIARRLGKPSCLFDALTTLGGSTLQILSKNKRADALLEEAWSIVDSVDGDEFLEHYGLAKGVAASIMTASLKTRMGELDAGEIWVERALSLAKESGHVHSQGLALGMGMEHFYARGEFDRLIDLNDQISTLAKRHGMPFWEALLSIPGEWAQVKSGAGNLATLMANHANYVQMGMKIDISLCSGLVADAAQTLGQMDTAEAWINQALHEATSIPEATFGAELCRIQGDILRAQGNNDGAIAAYQKGIDLSQRQGDIIFDLANSLHMARLFAETGEAMKAKSALERSVALFDGKGTCKRLDEARAYLASLP